MFDENHTLCLEISKNLTENDSCQKSQSFNVEQLSTTNFLWNLSLAISLKGKTITSIELILRTKQTMTDANMF